MIDLIDKIGASALTICGAWLMGYNAAEVVIAGLATWAIADVISLVQRRTRG